MKQYCKWLFLFISILCISSSWANAQNSTGTRLIDSTMWKGYWYDSTTVMFQHQYPIIQGIPPIISTMPYDVMISYIYTDSLFLHAPEGEVVERVKLWNSMNDTLKWMFKGYYLMTDYNPIIFKQYTYEINRYLKGIHSAFVGNINDTSSFTSSNNPYYKYTNSLLRTAQYSLAKLRKFAGNQKNPLYSVLNSDYVLRVNVISIDSTINKNSPLGYYRYNITAEVLDTLKGKVFQSVQPSSLTKKIKDEKILTESTLINFQYTPNVYSKYTESSIDGGNIFLRDSAFTDDDGSFRIKVGQEMVVFLSLENLKIDREYDYFDLDVNWTNSNGALPIINGNVRDVNLIWSPQLLSPYNFWKSNFMVYKNKILQMQY